MTFYVKIYIYIPNRFSTVKNTKKEKEKIRRRAFLKRKVNCGPLPVIGIDGSWPILRPLVENDLHMAQNLLVHQNDEISRNICRVDTRLGPSESLTHFTDSIFWKKFAHQKCVFRKIRKFEISCEVGPATSNAIHPIGRVSRRRVYPRLPNRSGNHETAPEHSQNTTNHTPNTHQTSPDQPQNTTKHAPKHR